MTLRYKEYGNHDAPLMLFIHGGGVSDWMWDEQVKHFTQHFHCIVPILPEHGLNNYKVPFTITGSAELLIELIEQKSAGKAVILIGFSLGSQVIIQLLSTKPDFIDFAIINSALVRPMTYAKPFIKPTIYSSFPLMKSKWFSKIQAKALYIRKDYYDQYYEESSRMKPDTLIRILQENMSFATPKGFQKVKTKMLVTVGEQEKAIMKKSARDIVAANENCIGVVIPHVGHGAPLAIPDFFNQMLEAWIREGELPEGCTVIK